MISRDSNPVSLSPVFANFKQPRIKMPDLLHPPPPKKKTQTTTRFPFEAQVDKQQQGVPPGTFPRYRLGKVPGRLKGSTTRSSAF